MNDQPSSCVKPEHFAKALQMEAGYTEPPSEDEILDSAYEFLENSDDPLLSQIGQKLASGESPRHLFDNPEAATLFQAMIHQTEQEFDEEIADQMLAMNDELNDLFEPDDDADSRNDS